MLALVEALEMAADETTIQLWRLLARALIASAWSNVTGRVAARRGAEKGDKPVELLEAAAAAGGLREVRALAFELALERFAPSFHTPTGEVLLATFELMSVDLAGIEDEVRGRK